MQVDLMGAIQEAKRRAQETASGDSGLISADDLNRILNLARASAGELPSIGIGHEMTPEESSWIKPQRPSYIGTRMERTLPEASWLDYITSGTANLFTRGAEEAKMWQNEYEEAAKSAQGRAPTPAEQQEIEMNAPDLLNLPENERAAAWHKRLAKAQEFRGERDMRAANKIKPTEFRRPESGLQSIAAEVLQNVPYSLKNMPSNALATMTMGVPGAFLGGALSAFGEGRDEGTDVYWDLRAKGVPHKEAFDRAMRHTGWTTGGLMLSDPIENMATFGLGKLFPNMSPFARTIVGAGVNMAGEGAEEGLEEVGAAFSKGEPIDWGNVGHASGIGAISGGIMGAAGNVLSNIANAYNNALKPDLNDVTSQVAEALYRENEVDRLENEYLDWYRDWGEPIEQRDAARADDYNEEDLAEANRQVEEFTAEQEQQRKAQEQAKREQEAADRELEAEDYLARLERDLTRQQQINQEYDLNALDDYYINEYENEAENLQRTNNNIVQNQRINQSQADINAQNRAYNANKQARQAQSEQQARENARLEQERENNANYNNSLAGITGQLTARNGEPNQLESIVQSLSLGQDRLNSGVNTFNELNNTINRLESAKGTDGDINRIIANIDRKLEQLRSETRSDTMRDNIRRDRAGRELQQELNARLEARDNRERQAERNNQAFNAQNEVNAQEREYNANKRDNQARQEARNHEIARLERERAALEDLQAISRERQAERNNQTFNAQNEVNAQNRDYNAVKQEQQARQTAQERENARLERERAAIAELQAVERERKSDAAKNNRVFNAQNEVNAQNREYEQNKRRQQAKRYNQQREADRLENDRQNLAVQMAKNELNKANKQAESDNADINSLLDAKESRLSQSEQKRETRETRKQERQEARNNQLTIDQSTSNAQKQEQDVTAAALESANKPTEKAALDEATREQDGASVETGKSADNLGRKNSIREVINAAKTGQGAKNSERIWVDYAEVTPEEAKKLSEATGLDIDDTYKHTFVGSGFIHSQKEHGITTEKHTAQLPVTEQDYEMIPEVIHNADNITRGNNKTATGRDTIVYTKHINGHVLIVEEVREKRGKLAFHTIRKSKPGYSYDTSKEGHPVVKEKADPREVRPERPQPEVKSPHAVNLDNTISQASESVKEPEVANKSVEKAALNEAKKKQEGGEEGESETNAGIKNKKTYNPYLDVDEDGFSRVNGMYLGLSLGGQTDATAKFFYRTDKGHYTAELDLSDTSKDNPYIRVLARGHLEIGSYNINTGELTIPNKTGVTQEEIDALIKEFKSLKYGIPAGIFNYKGYKIIYYLDVSAGTFNKKAQTYTPAVTIEVEGYPKIMGTYQPTTGKFFMNKTESPKLPRGPYIHWSAKEQKEFKTKFTEYYHTPEAQKRDIKFIYETVTSEREQTAGSENIVKDNKQGVKQAETNPKNRDTIKTAAGLEDTVTYKIVDASELIVSNKETGAINPDYPQELQPRDRTRQASLEQVAKIAQSLDPELLGRNKMASDGAPIIGSDMVVESGNGRVMAILQAFKNGKADKYIKYMREHAAEFGLSEADFDGIKQPVLVRVRDGKIDRKTFVQQANISTVSSMSPAERAKQDAAKITVNMLSKFDPNKEIRYNGEFIQDFASQIVEDNERGAFIDKNGQLSVQGLERVQNALLALAYQDDNLLIRMRESLDNDIKNVTNAMLQAAPKVALLEQGVKTGEIKSELSIHKDITQAASALAQIRRDGMTVQDYLAQGSLFSDANISNTAKALLQFFDDHKRSTKKITDLVIKYAELALDEGAANQQNMFGESQTRGKAHLLNDAIKYAEDAGNYGQIGLFGESYEQRTPREIDKDQISETYGEDEALDNVINSDEQYTRNVALGLDEAAEQVGKLEDAINSKAKNRPNADLSIKDDILNAVRAYDKLTKAGASVNAALNKLLKNESVPELKGLKLSDGAIGVLEIFDKVKGSGAKIAAALIKYSENALKADGRSKQELLTDALNYLDAKDGYQLDLDTRRLEQRIYNILKNLNHEQIDEASAAVYAPVIASRYKFLARISGLSIDDLINRRVFAYRADDSEKRGRGRPRKNTDTFNQPVIPEDQIEAVRKKYEDTEQWLKAPNGKKSNLNERQWLQVRTPAFKNWFGDWENDPENASKVVDENGEPLVVYHGTGRADRVGSVFRKDRATSGPMAFFTDDYEIGLNYSRDKADTSLSREDDINDPHNQFVIEHNGKQVKLTDYWGKLTQKQRDKIAQIAPAINFDEDLEGFKIQTGNTQGLGHYSYNLREANGNHLEALLREWISEGNLYNRESDFIEILKLVGVENVKYLDPEYREEAVYSVLLNIKNPLVTAEIPEKLIGKLEKAAEKAKMPSKRYNADLWDKSNITPQEWIDKLHEDIENGTTRAWTIIPDWVTKELKKAGYDGIKDTGNKYGGVEHTHNVYIPFESEQIKSATDNIGTFDPENPNIYYQAQIAQGEGLYDGLNLPFDPADLRTESGASIESAAKSDKILTPDGSTTLGVIAKTMKSKDGTEFPAGNIQANAGAVQYAEIHHGDEMRKAGYSDAKTFLLDVLNNYEKVYKGKGEALILAAHGNAKTSVKSVVSLNKNNNGVYVVNDAGIVTNRYFDNKELLDTRGVTPSPSLGNGAAFKSGSLQGQGTSRNYATPSSNSEQIINQNLNQDKGGVLRGKIDFDKQGKAIIHILKAANKSTVLHETAHLFLQDFRDLATNPDIQLTEAARNDWDALCDWLGIKDLDFSNPEGWSKAERDLWNDAQEKFAAGTEKYLWEGKVPTNNSRLKRIFEIIKGWFRAIYEKARDIKYINSKGEAVSFNISKAAHDVYDHIHTGGENMASWESERAANLEIGKADPNEYLTEDKLKDNNFVETTDEIDAKEVADLKAEREAKAAEDARPKNELGVLEDSEEHINNNNNNTEVKTLADMSEAITNPKKRGRPKTGGVLEAVKARLRALNRGEMITNLHPVNEPETTSVESEAISETIKDKRSSDSMLFTNPETEARFRNSRGDIQVRESTRNFWKDVGLKALSKNSKSGQNLINAKETFKRLTQSISASTATATNDMKKIIKNLTPAETELFMRKRIVDDLMWRKQEMPEAKLPWGLDGETLKADYERITKLAEANKNVANAIKADEQAISDLNKQMIELADKLGLSDLSKVLRNPHYFHHEILFNNDLAMTARANNSALGTENSKAEFTGIKTLDDLLNIVLNRSYMKKYKGSELDMNSNYLAVTADIRGQQLQDLAILKALNEIKENYDISDKLREAFNKNKANSSVESYSQEDYLKILEEQMAREDALRKSKGLKSESEENAGDGSGRAVDILNPRANNTQSSKTAEPVDYVKRLEDSIKSGDTVMGRLDRQLKLKKPVEIGKNSGLIDITDDGNIQIPEGYVAFDPDAHGLFGYDGRRSRIQVALSQGLEAAMTRTGLGEFTIEQIAEAMGHEEAKLWVIPKEVADTLKAFGAAKQPASFKKFLRKITKGWKLWQLFSPTQTIKYNLRNVTGDLDAIIAGNPQSLKYVGQATGELINSMFRGKAAEGELEQYLIRGGDLGSETAQYFTTGFTQAFFDLAKDPNFKVVTKELNGVKSFADFKRLSKRAFKALNKYSIGGIMKLSSFRENILRYATYLSYLEQMQRNENHMPDNWGASLREEIEAIPDIRDRAYKLSNELLGDYGSISELGMRLRDVAVPFYSWLEVNAKRYYRLLKNGIWDGNNKLDFSKGLLKGLAVQSPMIAYNTAKTLLWINALSIAIKAFNEAVNAGSGGADDDLPPEVKDRPHLTFGYTSDGRVSYFDRIGALLDIYDWVGQDSKGMIPFYRDIRDIINGNLSVTDFVKQTSSAAFNKAFNSLTPLLKMPVEIATGRTFYPDATHPRIIRDMTSYIAQSFGLSREVNALLGEPGRDYATWENWGSFKDLFRYTSDPKEGAYFYILDKVRYFQEHTLGKTFDGGAITRRGQALRKFKTAVRYKDRANQRRYLRQYYNLGGNRKTLKQSIKSMGPLTGLSKDEKRQFMRSLTPEDRKYLRRAWRYFYDLAASMGVKVKYEYY